MTTILTETGHPVEHKTDRAALTGIPKLFWAGAVMFLLNIGVGAAIYFEPEMRVTMYGEERPAISATGRPSPFAVTVDLAKPRAARPPEKLRPVAFEPVPDVFGLQESASVLPASYPVYVDAVPSIGQSGELPSSRPSGLTNTAGISASQRTGDARLTLVSN